MRCPLTACLFVAAAILPGCGDSKEEAIEFRNQILAINGPVNAQFKAVSDAVSKFDGVSTASIEDGYRELLDAIDRAKSGLSALEPPDIAKAKDYYDAYAKYLDDLDEIATGTVRGIVKSVTHPRDPVMSLETWKEHLEGSVVAMNILREKAEKVFKDVEFRFGRANYLRFDNATNQ